MELQHIAKRRLLILELRLAGLQRWHIRRWWPRRCPQEVGQYKQSSLHRRSSLRVRGDYECVALREHAAARTVRGKRDLAHVVPGNPWNAVHICKDFIDECVVAVDQLRHR